MTEEHIQRIFLVSRLALVECRIKIYQKGALLNYRFEHSDVSLFYLLG